MSKSNKKQIELAIENLVLACEKLDVNASIENEVVCELINRALSDLYKTQKLATQYRQNGESGE